MLKYARRQSVRWSPLLVMAALLAIVALLKMITMWECALPQSARWSPLLAKVALLAMVAFRRQSETKLYHRDEAELQPAGDERGRREGRDCVISGGGAGPCSDMGPSVTIAARGNHGSLSAGVDAPNHAVAVAGEPRKLVYPWVELGVMSGFWGKGFVFREGCRTQMTNLEDARFFDWSRKDRMRRLPRSICL